ncbi:MAG: transposase domain-containing protein [Spirochaetia bacterium]
MAGLYSLVETAKANSLEPYRYLRAVIERLPTSTNYRSLLPNYIDFE